MTNLKVFTMTKWYDKFIIRGTGLSDANYI